MSSNKNLTLPEQLATTASPFVRIKILNSYEGHVPPGLLTEAVTYGLQLEREHAALKDSVSNSTPSHQLVSYRRISIFMLTVFGGVIIMLLALFNFQVSKNSSQKLAGAIEILQAIEARERGVPFSAVRIEPVSSVLLLEDYERVPQNISDNYAKDISSLYKVFVNNNGTSKK